MTRRVISSGSPLETRYGYSRAVVDGDLVFVAGTTGYDPATKSWPEDVAAQTRNIFETVSAALAAAGSNLAQVARVQYFVTDRAYCETVLAVAGELLADIRPAASIYVISGLLTAEMKVEIEVTARLSTSEPRGITESNLDAR